MIFPNAQRSSLSLDALNFLLADVRAAVVALAVLALAMPETGPRDSVETAKYASIGPG